MARWPSGAASGATTTAEEMMQSLDDPEFQLAVEVLYHGSRQAFLSAAHRWMMFATILFGASAAATLFPTICGLLAAATGAADIAFDFTGRAQAHADIRRRYLVLVATMAVDEEKGKASFGTAYAEITTDEPPTYRWAQDVAYRNACIALGQTLPEDPLPQWKRLLAHVWCG